MKRALLWLVLTLGAWTCSKVDLEPAADGGSSGAGGDAGTAGAGMGGVPQGGSGKGGSGEPVPGGGSGGEQLGGAGAAATAGGGEGGSMAEEGGASGQGGDVVVPEFLATDGVMLDDFDSGKEHRDDTCLLNQRQFEDRNLLGFCTACFRDCLGDDGGDVETDLETDPAVAFRGRGQSLRLSFDVRQADLTDDEMREQCRDNGGEGGAPNLAAPANTRFAGFIEFLTDEDIEDCPGQVGYLNLAALNVQSLTFWWKPDLEKAEWGWDENAHSLAVEVALRDSTGQTRNKQVARWDLSDPPCDTVNGWRQECFDLEDLEAEIDLRELRELNLTFTAPVTDMKFGAVLIDEIAFAREACSTSVCP